MAAPIAPIMGADGRLYFNVGAVFGAPQWELVTGVKDVEPSSSFTDIDVSARYSNKIKQHEPGFEDVSLSLTLLYNPYDPFVAYCLVAARARAPVGLLILDAAVDNAGSQGFQSYFKIFNRSRKEPLDGAMEITFDFKPCFTPPGFGPDWVTIS